MAAELPENLQVIKLEPPGTPEKSNIKERLNLHVKRRLQQEIPETPPPEPTTSNKRCKPTTTTATTPQSKELQKCRKPYQKRIEKSKTDSGKGKKTPTACATAELEAFDESADLEASPETPEAKNVNRDRYKNADILSIVLSRKKRALMHDPQVQLFWSQIMSALRD